ncbi:hypothetical protein [Pectobacterium brasiliense]|uniref:hypothetical protein n=1 Tax=Pectobacterium brasiliense TaxID=180957 RepID=UPI00057EBA3B|nr:hypothetical protein [Pectobacterium brasiliense]KHT21026.1 hypothetical protein RC97_02960 [Pectobacterium brasiliense]
MSKETGGSAFPMLGNVGFNSDWQMDEGMTLRDYFAAKAMSAFISRWNGCDSYNEAGIYQRAAEHSYEAADAMLKARIS